MDSATQFLLGASIGGAMLGGKLGPRALLVGGIVATLPDLDYLFPLDDAIDTMTYHRGVTHSLLVQTAVAPAIAGVVWIIIRKAQIGFWPILLTVWLCLTTHALLDSLTTYGTQLFWPLDTGPPFALPSIFIIDPLYTGLLIAGCLGLYLKRRHLERAVRFNRIFLVLSTLYLAVGMTSHFVVRAKAEAQPQLAGMSIHVQPTPFNIVIWQVLAVDDRRYLTGFTSPVFPCRAIAFAQHPRLAAPPPDIPVRRSVRRLEWFTAGFFSYRPKATDWLISDLRIGFHPAFIFTFKFAEAHAATPIAVDPVRVEVDRLNGGTLAGLLSRMVGEATTCRAPAGPN